jgi:zinc protease
VPDGRPGEAPAFCLPDRMVGSVTMPRAVRIASLAPIALVLTACALLRPASVADSPVRGQPLRHVLPNGVRVVVEEHRASDVVALQLWVRTGGRDEAPSELGLAHYLEHLLFKGTPTRPPGFVEREIEGAGGRMNAGTSWDYTFYHTVLPASQARAGIAMLADISVNASLEEGLLEAEKHVVLEEMRLNQDDPRRFLARRLYTVLFDGHPYGREVIGTPELVRGLRRETLLAFYRRHYVPAAFTLVVVGAVDPAEVLAAATQGFARIPRGGDRLPAPPPPPARAAAADLARPGANAHLGLAWQAPRLDHADTPAMDLLVSILGQSRGSRLTTALREQQGLVTSISAGYSALEAAGALLVTAVLQPGHLEGAEQGIVAEIRRLRDAGVTDAERRRAVTVAEARREFSRETAEGRARALGHAETVWRLEEELAYLDRLRAVTAAQIQAVARRYVDPERYVRVALRPPTP